MTDRCAGGANSPMSPASPTTGRPDRSALTHLTRHPDQPALLGQRGADQLGDQPGEVATHPGDGGELETVGALVQCQPAPELDRGGAGAPAPAPARLLRPGSHSASPRWAAPARTGPAPSVPAAPAPPRSRRPEPAGPDPGCRNHRACGEAFLGRCQQHREGGDIPRRPLRRVTTITSGFPARAARSPPRPTGAPRRPPPAPRAAN